MTGAGLLSALMPLAVVAALVAGVPVILAIGGVPLLFAMAGAALGVFDPYLLSALPSRVYGIMANGLLLAVPFFVVMGVVLDRAGIAGPVTALAVHPRGPRPRTDHLRARPTAECA